MSNIITATKLVGSTQTYLTKFNTISHLEYGSISSLTRVFIWISRNFLIAKQQIYY